MTETNLSMGDQTEHVTLPARSKRRHDDMAHSRPTTTDVSIMGTNDSSIVSKRSVEVLYHPKPHFFQHFVKKPKRRAPLINRGYWLRMRAIEHELQDFLRIQDGKRKVVINLGCGYDPLPFQMLSKSPAKELDMMFVDVDYPDLIANKVRMINAAPELAATLPGLRAPADNGLTLQSERYVALGCDLSKPKLLESLLEKFLTLSETSICFVAEVSITYMKEKAADTLIKWASSMPQARFVQLEQCLPYGERHPFASTMLKHFSKLGTRLRSLPNYPTEAHQVDRFLDRSWKNVSSRSLWKLWALPGFLSPEERYRLDEVEPFDEWEEFALFASHYFVLTATNQSIEQVSRGQRMPPGPLPSKSNASTVPSQSTAKANSLPRMPARSFASSFLIGDGIFGVHGGHGSRARLSSVQFLVGKGSFSGDKYAEMPSEVEGRTCHTITELSNTNLGGESSSGSHRSHLLVGGRTSPDKAFADTWLVKASHADGPSLEWQRAPSLPHGLYRHSATALIKRSTGTAAGILVSWGKTNRSHISEKWYFWPFQGELVNTDLADWVEIEVRGSEFQGSEIRPRFGANLVLPQDISADALDDPIFSGYLIGGIGSDGIVLQDWLEWTLSLTERSVTIRSRQKVDGTNVCRFGASATKIPSLKERGGGGVEGVMITGGIGASCAAANQAYEILRPPAEDERDMIVTKEHKYPGDPEAVPLLVGHTTTYVGDGQMLIAGGAATCFSFGTFHNQKLYMLQQTSSGWTPVVHSWHTASTKTHQDAKLRSYVPGAPKAEAIRRIAYHELEKQSFTGIVESGIPLVIHDFDLGQCTRKWDLLYLKDRIGADRQVIVHESDNKALDFQNKNFRYQKVPFGQFVTDIASGARHYLRALSSESAKKPADFWQDYPELAADFTLPELLSTYMNFTLANGQPRQHSSVFRVSGPVSMWLHYDVMSNILCQVHGKKRLLLYPPGDVRHLEIPPGQSSSSLNMFASKTYRTYDLQHLHPTLVDLEPGDVLFIPALWLHTVLPTSGTSIAVNIFFRDLDAGYAAGRDVYGNRDLQAYEDGRRDAKRIEGRFASLPPERKRFYLLRLAQEMLDMVENAGS